MLICCPPSLITSLRQTFIISGQFSSLPITEKALLCVVWAGGRAPVPTTKNERGFIFPSCCPQAVRAWGLDYTQPMGNSSQSLQS